MRPAFLDKFTAGKPGREAQLGHVLRNLESVLNTKEGYGFFQRGFGIADHTGERDGGDMAQFLTDEFQRAITHYEPRLREVEVRSCGQDGALRLHFEVSGRMGQEELSLSLTFDTVSGQVNVKRKA